VGLVPLPSGGVLLGIARRTAIEHYMELFTAAGIAISSFTFSAAAVHTAVRLNGHRDGEGFVGLGRTPEGAVEVYGESPWRPVFFRRVRDGAGTRRGAGFGRTAAAAGNPADDAGGIAAPATVNPVENDLSRNATAVRHGAGRGLSRLAPAANVLPREYRRSRSRAMFVPTAVLAGLALAALIGMIAWPKFEDRRYLKTLEAQIARVQPGAVRAAALDREPSERAPAPRCSTNTADGTRAPIWTRSASSPAW